MNNVMMILKRRYFDLNKYTKLRSYEKIIYSTMSSENLVFNITPKEYFLCTAKGPYEWSVIYGELNSFYTDAARF